MTGYVHTINRRRGLVAIATDKSGFTIVELVANDLINIGDEMEWEDETALGSAVYSNVTRRTKIKVNVQEHGVPGSHVRKKLRL